jgi:hypothetical protein
MTLKWFRGSLVLFVLFAARRDGLANVVREYSLEKKTRLSDIVVIGQVVSIHQEPGAGAPLEYAHIQVDKVLKGSALKSVDILSKGSIAEADPECCEVGRVYLFFLVKEQKNIFESVNGRFGIYAIPTANVAHSN